MKFVEKTLLVSLIALSFSVPVFAAPGDETSKTGETSNCQSISDRQDNESVGVAPTFEGNSVNKNSAGSANSNSAPVSTH